MSKFNIKREVCAKCNKTVYAEEEVTAVSKKWHKACFRCQGDGCNISLDLKNYFGFEGKVFCKNHVPKPKATTIADDVMTQHIRSVPQKASEGLGQMQKGAGGHVHMNIVADASSGEAKVARSAPAASADDGAGDNAGAGAPAEVAEEAEEEPEPEVPAAAEYAEESETPADAEPEAAAPAEYAEESETPADAEPEADPTEHEFED